MAARSHYAAAPEGTPAAPVSLRDRAMLRRRLADLPAVARRRGTTLSDWDRRIEEAAGRTHFEVGAWLWWAQQRGERLTLDDRARVVFAVLASGLTTVGYEFFTVFEAGERDWDSFFEMNDGAELVEAVAARVRASGHPVALAGLRANGWDRPRRQPELFTAEALA